MSPTADFVGKVFLNIGILFVMFAFSFWLVHMADKLKWRRHAKHRGPFLNYTADPRYGSRLSESQHRNLWRSNRAYRRFRRHAIRQNQRGYGVDW